MKWIKKYHIYKESKNYSSKNLISEICVSMILLNNEFLDQILDRGIKARYSEDTHVFLTDLKNLLLSKNRLSLGMWNGEKFVSDDEISKVNGIFEKFEFNIEKDWNLLINARVTARNIIDKLLADEKLESSRINKIYWIGPNKKEDFDEDIVIETKDGLQYSLYLNKNISLQKTSSFNTFADDLIPTGIEQLYSEENLRKWNKLTQEFIRITYECSSKPLQQEIEKFIDPNRIDTISYFEFFEIKHRDPRFKHLGEFIKPLNQNILKFSDLLNLIWKNKERYFTSLERAEKEWTESKIVILNSRILEHLLTTTLKEKNLEEILKKEDTFKQALGTVKMKLTKTIVNKLACSERTVYYLSKNGNSFYRMPSKEFFRNFYDKLDIYFDYHQNFKIYEDDENEDINDFTIKIKLLFGDVKLLQLDIVVKFSGGELTNKLSAKHKFEIPDDFNFQIKKIIEGDTDY